MAAPAGHQISSAVGKNLSDASTGGAAGVPGANKPTTFEELNRILQSRGTTLSHRIQSVLAVLEENPEDLRGFFSTCYQPLLWQIFNFDDGASGWLQSVSTGNDREAWTLLDFLSPKGPLMKAVLAADADGLMHFAFPLERLPVRTQRLLQTDPVGLNARPPYRNCVQRDANDRCHVHLGLYHYFFFWSAYYACSAARGSSSAGLAGNGRRQAHAGTHSRPQWMDWPMAGLMPGSGGQRIHPYRELLLSHLMYFLPRGGAHIRAWGSTGAAGWARGSEVEYRAGNVSQGEMLVSIMIEFWLPGSDNPGFHENVGGARSQYQTTMETRTRAYSSPYGDAASMQRQYSYNPPNEDLVNAVVLLATYLFADAPGANTSAGNRVGQGASSSWMGSDPPSPRSPSASQGLSTASGSKRTTPHAASPTGSEQDLAEEVERAKEMLQKPLYRFLRDAFTHWPAESTASLGPLMNLWVTYLAPWTLVFPVPLKSSRATLASTSTLSRGIGAVTSATAERKSSVPNAIGDTSQLSVSTASTAGRNGRRPQVDEAHILHNVPFYCELMRHFLELCCNRVPVDAEGTATALLSVLRGLASCPEVLHILEGVEGAYNAFVAINPYAATASAYELPATRYDAFLPLIQSQVLDWDPPPPPPAQVAGGTSMSTPTGSGPLAATYMRGRTGDPYAVASAGPSPVRKLSMFSVDQDGLPQVALALLDRLDRDSAAVGPSHPLRERVPRLRQAAFTVFQLDRLGESIARTPSLKKKEFKSAAEGTHSRRGIGWASFDKAKTSEEMYMGDWYRRPLTDVEFGPLARILIAISHYINSTLGLTDGKRVQLRPVAEYGNLIAAAGAAVFIWFLLLPIS